MRLVILAIVLWATPAFADQIDECPKREKLALGTRVEAKRHTVYEVPLADLRVCIDKTAYPLMRGGGHELLACFIVAKGKDAARFCGTANAMYKDWHGYRVKISLRTKRYTDPPDVWLQIDATP
jgi:hypothetical protein